MLGVGYTAYAIARSRTSITRLQELLANVAVYPFSTSVEPCCGFKVAVEGAPLVPANTAAELRAQAAHARHLADNMHNREAEQELRQIADALDVDADNLEVGEPPDPMPAPSDASTGLA